MTTSDGGGSIRIPAACCGLFGLKPGRGLVPMGPAHGEAMHGAATNGVMSPSVRDSAAMLDVLVGGEPSGPYIAATPSESLLSQVGAEPDRLRIGVCTAPSINSAPHPQDIAAVETAARALRASVTTSRSWRRDPSTTWRSPGTSSPADSRTSRGWSRTRDAGRAAQTRDYEPTHGSWRRPAGRRAARTTSMSSCGATSTCGTSPPSSRTSTCS